jgi:hypothetical protein
MDLASTPFLLFSIPARRVIAPVTAAAAAVVIISGFRDGLLQTADHYGRCECVRQSAFPSSPVILTSPDRLGGPRRWRKNSRHRTMAHNKDTQSTTQNTGRDERSRGVLFVVGKEEEEERIGRGSCCDGIVATLRNWPHSHLSPRRRISTRTHNTIIVSFATAEALRRTGHPDWVL